MKLLIVTQKVDYHDPVLGFFHRWLEEFSKHCEKIIVICLEKGVVDLPGNIEVLSLGKESGRSRLKYIFRFYKYVWLLRNQYDLVFVHMNQEYVLLAGNLWKLMGKKVMLWRNHKQGSWLTWLAVLLSNKVFYTSPQSYTARFNKAVQMPVGVDTEFFKPDPYARRVKNSVLFLGRISPVKKVLEFIEWAKQEGYKVTLAGPILPIDKEYGERVLEALTQDMKYLGPVTQVEAKKLYQTHEIYANFTPAGSFDKTIFEAFACGCKLEVRNPDVGDINREEQSLDALLAKLQMEVQ